MNKKSNKVNFDINTFDWSSIKEDDTILSVKGPFTWLKLNWLLGIIRVPFTFVGVFTTPLLFLDLLIIIPTLYGLYHRKKWAYYFLLFSLGVSGLIVIASDPYAGIVVLFIYVIPNFIYHAKRIKIFSNYDGRFEDILNEENIKKSYEKIVTPISKSSKKFDETISSAVKDYKIDQKIDSALKTAKVKFSELAKNIDKSSKDRSITIKLRELKTLLDEGIINQDEFDEKKSELLKKL